MPALPARPTGIVGRDDDVVKLSARLHATLEDNARLKAVALRLSDFEDPSLHDRMEEARRASSALTRHPFHRLATTRNAQPGFS